MLLISCNNIILDTGRISILATIGDRSLDYQIENAKLTVTGTNMVTIRKEVTSSSLVLTVPKGIDRTFVLKVSLSNGQDYWGISKVDIFTSSVFIYIDLLPVIDGTLDITGLPQDSKTFNIITDRVVTSNGTVSFSVLDPPANTQFIWYVNNELNANNTSQLTLYNLNSGGVNITCTYTNNGELYAASYDFYKMVTYSTSSPTRFNLQWQGDENVKYKVIF